MNTTYIGISSLKQKVLGIIFPDKIPTKVGSDCITYFYCVPFEYEIQSVNVNIVFNRELAFSKQYSEKNSG